MKAAVIEPVGHALATEVPDPTPGPREVVVEAALPIVPGHEFAGKVVGAGNAAAVQDGLDRVHNQEITITGSMAVLHSYERAADLFATAVLDPDLFISDRIPLDRSPEALEQFARGVEGKTVVVP